MPSRGLHGPSRVKSTKKSAPTRPPIRADDPSWPHLAQMLGEIVAELHHIGELLERLHRPPPGPLPEPSEFVSGGFHRRSGDIYQSVAEPGTPNAGSVDPLDKEADEEFFKKARLRMPDGNDPSGSL